MARHALYIVGEPGAGKSSMVEALTLGQAGAAARQPLAHLHYAEAGVVELGARRDTFSGTDALAMNAITAAEAWVMEPAGNPFIWPADLLLAEGDRLACDRFFNALLAGGWDLVICHLATPPAIAAERRVERGSAQNDTWLRGRQTKVSKLVERWSDHVARLDGLMTPAGLAAHLALMSPVAAAFVPEYQEED